MREGFAMDLRHDMVGEGPTLMLIHGVVHRRQAWDAVLDYLTPYRRVITVDLPGHGESPDIAARGAERLDVFTESLSDLVATCRHAYGPVHAAGNSLGGYLAIRLAARGDVASATALSPAGFWNDPADQRRGLAKFQILRAAGRRMGDRAPTLMRSRVVRYPGLALFFAHPSRISYDAALLDLQSLCTNTTIQGRVDEPFPKPAFVDPEVPLTVAWGGRDRLLPRRHQKNVLAHYPQARMSVVPGVGHVPMTDNPELIASILLAGSNRTAQADGLDGNEERRPPER